jgi:hypothetical protein
MAPAPTVSKYAETADLADESFYDMGHLRADDSYGDIPIAEHQALGLPSEASAPERPSRLCICRGEVHGVAPALELGTRSGHRRRRSWLQRAFRNVP